MTGWKMATAVAFTSYCSSFFFSLSFPKVGNEMGIEWADAQLNWRGWLRNATLEKSGGNEGTLGLAITP